MICPSVWARSPANFAATTIAAPMNPPNWPTSSTSSLPVSIPFLFRNSSGRPAIRVNRCLSVLAGRIFPVAWFAAPVGQSRLRPHLVPVTNRDRTAGDSRTAFGTPNSAAFVATDPSASHKSSQVSHAVTDHRLAIAHRRFGCLAESAKPQHIGRQVGHASQLGFAVFESGSPGLVKIELPRDNLVCALLRFAEQSPASGHGGFLRRSPSLYSPRRTYREKGVVV